MANIRLPYLMVIVMFALSLTVYEIFANQEKCKNVDLEIEGQGVEKQDLSHSTRNVQIKKGNFSEF